MSSWLELLGVLSSMIQLIPGGRLRMRSLQLVLRRSWDHSDQTILISWTPEIRLDLEWWLNRARLEQGISLAQVSPQLDLWSDVSDVGWGLISGKRSLQAFWSREEVALSINARELCAVENALLFFAPRTTLRRLLTFATKGALDLSSSTPFLNAFCDGRSLFRWCWLRNSLWVATTSWRIPFPDPIRS